MTATETTASSLGTTPRVPEPPRTRTPVNLEYEHEPSHKNLPYPSEEKLQNKTDDALQQPVWRIHVKHKGAAKPVPLNKITFKGIDASHQIPDLDGDELQQTILGICYQSVRKRAENTSYQIVYMIKVAGGRSTRMECTFELDPKDFPEDPEGHDTRDDRELDHERDESDRRRRHEDAIRAYEEAPLEGAFHPSFRRPYEDRGPSQARPSWRQQALGDSHDSRHSVSDPDGSRFLARRDAFEAQLDDPLGRARPTIPHFDPRELPPELQAAYARHVLPFAMINQAQATAAYAHREAIDMVVAANREQSRMHALQMHAVMDRERQLMQFPMQFLNMEAQNKGHYAELLQKSHEHYVDSLKMRGEMNNRELGYQQQNLHNQYALADVQRQMTDQSTKHQQEKTETWRRDLIRGLAPMALSGIGMFLDYFGQQKLGQAARMSGQVVEGIFQSVEQQQAAQQSAPGAPSSSSPSAPTPTPSGGAPQVPHSQQRGQNTVVDVPTQPQIPRRVVRVLDVATPQDAATQPLRTLCRMAGLAFSQPDRERLRSVLTPDEIQQLEHVFVANSDGECISGLGNFMFSVGRDEPRKQRMLAMFTPGQNELLTKIGDVMKGELRQLDPNYEVEIRPKRSRMRTVLRTQQAPSQTPTPPLDLDDPCPAPSTTPTPPADLDEAPTDAPRPTPTPPADAPRPTTTPSHAGRVPTPMTSEDSPLASPEEVPPPLSEASASVDQALAAIMGRLESFGTELDSIRGELKTVKKASEKPAHKSRSSSKKTRKKKPAVRANRASSRAAKDSTSDPQS